MKKNKKALGIFMSLFCFTNIIFSQEFDKSIKSMEDIFSKEIIKELKEKKKVQVYRYSEKNIKNEILPKTEFAKNVEKIWKDSQVPLIEIEALYYIPKTQKNGEQERSDIKIIRESVQKISKLEGFEYYSNSKKKREILYKKSYSIDNIKEKNKILDSIDENIDGKEIFILQNDNTFGEYASKVKYAEKDNEISFVYTNMEPVGMSFFKGADPEKMQIYVLIENLKNEIVLYAKLMIDFPNFPGIKNMMKSSLMTRIDAIAMWFETMYLQR
ncbi:MAG: hypothetical protein GX220_01865 [Treponema sp.]|mgnify:CR=1 FL=1|nr:hypothetical protein [Treponema sp.]